MPPQRRGRPDQIRQRRHTVRPDAENLVTAFPVQQGTSLQQLQERDVAVDQRRPDDPVCQEPRRVEGTDEVELVVDAEALPVPQSEVAYHRFLPLCSPRLWARAGNTRVMGTGSAKPSRRATCVATAKTVEESREPENATPQGGRASRDPNLPLEGLRGASRPSRRTAVAGPVDPERGSRMTTSAAVITYSGSSGTAVS